MKHTVKVFTTPEGAASYINTLYGNAPTDGSVIASGDYFVHAEIGNERGWVKYDVSHGHNINEIIESLDTAMQMHLGFYDEGESCTPYRTKEDAA